MVSHINSMTNSQLLAWIGMAFALFYMILSMIDRRFK